MHEVSSVRAAIRAAEDAVLGEGSAAEVRISVGGHLLPVQIAGLFELLAVGTALEGAAVVVKRDDGLGAELRVDSVVVSRTGSA